MIRRAFWMTVGAAGGIMGYRRVTALGRRLSGQGTAGRSRSVARDAIRATREVQSFSRDVREGMDAYIARRPRGKALPSVQAQCPPAGTARRAPRGHARPETDGIGHASDNHVNMKDDR